MAFRHRVTSFFRTLFRTDSLERDLDDELRASVDELVARKIRSGLTPEQARRLALLELGGLEQVKEEIRGRRIGQEAVTTARDIRYGARLLARSPAFAVVALLTLALGIGATVTVFSVTHAVLWRPLPYPDADRLVLVRVDARGVANAGAAGGEILDLRERSRSLAAVETANGVDAHVYVDGDYEHVAAASVSDGVLPLLGAVPLALGRTLRAAEDVGQAWVRSVVISDALWRRSFGADPGALGRQIQVNNLDVRIVGILRPDFRVFLPPETLAAEEIDVWFPKPLEHSRDNRGLPVLGRLQPGATLEQAQAELDALAAQFTAEHQSAYSSGPLRLSVRSLHEALTGEIQAALLALAGAVAFVLLIACVNVANLMLARGQARAREIAVRGALGASRARLVRQLLAESLLLAISGAACGLLLAHLGVELVEWLRPSHLPRQSEIAVDRTVVLFTVALTALTTLILGVLPAMRLTADPGPSFLNTGRVDTGAPAVRRLQRALVIVEVALSIVPLVAAGLMLRTFVNLTQAPIGFEPANVLTASVPITPSKFREFPERRAPFLREILRHVAQLPGVEDVSAGAPLPFGTWQATRRYGKDDDPSAPMSLATQQSVMPGFLRIMGIALREGRDFTLADVEARRRVAIVDEQIARQLWPDGAVGKRLRMQVGRDHWPVEIIGVTNAVRVTRVREVGLPHVFVPYHLYSIQMSLVIKTRESAAALGPAIERAIEPLGTGRAVFDVRPMADYVADSIADTRFTLLVLLGFASASLLLAGVGLYGTLAYLITQRTKEFGVRAALGASAGRLVGTVVREAAGLAAVGGVIGLAGAAAVTGLLRGLLYEVTPFDTLTIVIVSFAVAVTAILAAARPAWRVARLDPTLALRTE